MASCCGSVLYRTHIQVIAYNNNHQQHNSSHAPKLSVTCLAADLINRVTSFGRLSVLYGLLNKT